MLKDFLPPDRWIRPLIIFCGLFVGIGLYSIYASRVWTYLSDDPSACVNCHIMGPQYATWEHSSHKNITNCNECHVPHDNIFRKYYFKAKDGLNHSRLFTMRAERQVIFIGDAGKKVVKENCIRCHAPLLDQSKFITKTKGRYTPHNTDRECWECHKTVPHGKIRSLSSTPNAFVPVPKSIVPQWINKIFNK